MEQGTAPFSFFQKQRSEKHRKEGKTGVMFDIQEELKNLPGKPGVYIMHDAKDTIIYVGKAISLKNRVRQYFQSSRNLGIKKEQMVQQIARFEYIITDSELEALVLECNLIKEHRPKYNTLLKDDKTYPDFSRLDTFPVQNPLQHPGNLFHLLLCFSFSKHVILQTYSQAQTHFSHTQDVQDPARSSFSGGSASHAAYFLPQNSRHHPRPVPEACVLLLLFSDFA